MASDEREIRTVHSVWIDAVNAGDLARLLTLVAEDVVFLTPGQAPVDREGFSSNFMAAHQQMRICCTSELEEVEPTPITPVSFRYGFRVGGSPRRRGSAFGR